MPAVGLAVPRRLALVVVPSPPKSLRDVVALLLPGQHAGVPFRIGARLGAHGLLLRRWRWGCPVSRVMMHLRFTPAFALPAACFCFAGTESSSMALRELGPYSRDPAGLEGTQGRVTGGM